MTSFTHVNHAPKCATSERLLAIATLLAAGVARSRLVGKTMHATPYALLHAVGDMAARATEVVADSSHLDRRSSRLELSNTADLHPGLAVDASQKREVRS
ncbi:MAG: hypothetical protein KF812_11495 [Fimbriimonadaceae bacterium]|nr:hypothetical protein [Fimbriimonadaceae bacterium]